MAKKDVSTTKNFNRVQCSKITIRKSKNPMTGRVGVKKEKIEKALSIVVREKREKSTPVEIKEKVVTDGVDHENNTELSLT